MVVNTVVNAQDLLFYSSTINLNGTDRLIETDPYCVTPAIQFNGSSLLFSSNRLIWIKQNGIYKRVRSNYATYLVNPTIVPVSTILWWTFPCNQGDVTGGVSSQTYIPQNSSYATTATCEFKAPIIYVCEGNVPSTMSPSKNPSKNPTQPTRLPSANPSGNPTKQPTKIPTSDAKDLANTIGFWTFAIVVIWLIGQNKI
jgi:hypothetical protein